MVGDGASDIEAGRMAGVLTCGVTYGFGAAHDIAAAKPDLTIHELPELQRYIC
jgi:phosphoglycolate phosphatase